MGESLTTKQLAELHDVSVRTVESWCKRGLPYERKGRGRLFDNVTVANWLAAEGIEPGARGRKGAKARWGSDEPPQPLTYENGDGELGLEAALERTRCIEMTIGESIKATLRGDAPATTLIITGKLKHYKEIVSELRQLEKGLIELQEERGDVVRRVEMMENLTSLAALFRSNLERFPGEQTSDVIAALGEAGVDVPDMATFQRTLSERTRQRVDAWLRELADEIR